MHFAYDGFTHDHDTRCFTFRGIEEHTPIRVFRIEIDLALLAQSRVPMQEAPIFCLQLLTTASLGGASFLERFHKYRVVAEDFCPLLIEREKRAAEKAMKKAPHRPIRKPGSISNIQLTSSIREH